MQKAKQSLVETLWGTAIGFVLSVLVWEFVVKPVWGLQTSFIQNIHITLLFTVVSIIRGYVIRRFFNLLTQKNYKKEQHELHRQGGRPEPVRAED